jgi:hypothetical protein
MDFLLRGRRCLASARRSLPMSGSGRGFWQMAAVHAAIWTLLLCVLYPNLSLALSRPSRPGASVNSATTNCRRCPGGWSRSPTSLSFRHRLLRRRTASRRRGLCGRMGDHARIAASILVVDGVHYPAAILDACRIVVVWRARNPLPRPLGVLAVVWAKYFVLRPWAHQHVKPSALAFPWARMVSPLASIAPAWCSLQGCRERRRLYAASFVADYDHRYRGVLLRASSWRRKFPPVFTLKPACRLPMWGAP